MSYTIEEAQLPLIILNASIEKLPVKSRIVNNFKKLGIYNLAELIELIGENNENLHIFGHKSRQEIRYLLTGIKELPPNW